MLRNLTIALATVLALGAAVPTVAFARGGGGGGHGGGFGGGFGGGHFGGGFGGSHFGGGTRFFMRGGRFSGGQFRGDHFRGDRRFNHRRLNDFPLYGYYDCGPYYPYTYRYPY